MTFRIKVPPLMALAMAAICRGADPVTQPASLPATAAATQAESQPSTAPVPVPPALDPKAVVQLFLIGILSGDEKVVFDSLALTTEDARKEAQVVIGEAIAQHQFDSTIALAYENKTPEGQPSPEEVELAMIEEMKKQITNARVAQLDDAAEVTVDGGPIISLLRQKEVWKIDFDKTQRDNSGPADKNKMALLVATTGVYKQMNADIRAGKFRTAKEAHLELAKRLAQLPAVPMVVAADGPDGQRKAALADLGRLRLAINSFELDNGRFPSAAEGLKALTKSPAGLEKSWRKAFDTIPRDPWGNDYIYRYPGTLNLPDQFDLVSPGPDGKVGTIDDLNQTSK